LVRATREVAFEDAIEAWLLEHGGYEQGVATHYDPVLALDRIRAVCRGQMLLVDAIDWWLTKRHPRRPLAELEGLERPWWWKPNQAAVVQMVRSAGFQIRREPLRVLMPEGAGQRPVPLRMAALRSTQAREALLRKRVGDPHVAVLATPAL
jgi:tRNA (mo5U34)-methyltransferase